MGTINDKLDTLDKTKSNIASAIEELGIEVSEEDTFASYATKIQTAAATKADLVGGVIPEEQLPSYVDDVLEFKNINDFPQIGESGKIYLDTTANILYRWNKTEYAEISVTIDYASEEEAIDGTSNTEVMTPVTTKAAVDNALIAINEAIAKNAKNIEKLQANAETELFIINGGDSAGFSEQGDQKWQ